MPSKKSRAPPRKELEISCPKCHWMYSTRNSHCPMCGTPQLLDFDTLVKALQEYVELQGSWIVEKEAKKFIDAYRKRYKKLPDLDALWKTAIKLSKIEEMSEAEIQKKKAEQARAKSKEKDEVKRKMKELQKKKLEEQKKKEEREKRKRRIRKKKKQAVKSKALICPKCKEKNPADSKFCLNCGNKFEA